MIRILKHWHKSPSDVLDALSLETLKVKLDRL